MRRVWLLVSLAVFASAPPAVAQPRTFGPVLHEPIPPDPREDVALSVALDGDLRPAITTANGMVSAPDPSRPIGAGDAPYSTEPTNGAPQSTFRPDRNTNRPDVLPYDDPFTPSTAPFKRLSAYDQIASDYTLSVRDPRTTSLAVAASPEPASFEDLFYADMVVDLAAGKPVRIPSVGPGARVLRAHAGVGSLDVKFSLSRDGADNWFIEGDTTTRARLVMELAIPRAAFGGELGRATRAELLPVPPLPANVATSAAEVSRKIGVSAAMAPRDIVTKLVSYFRAFADSEQAPSGKGDIYLDLALSQKGVCRHRAFAFLVTAQSVGIPTRMISNEAHAWVEVHDGRMWRRIDLGGAGRMLHDPLSNNVPHEPPADPFAWPANATRGNDLADRARRDPPPASSAPGSGPNGTSGASATNGASGPSPNGTTNTAPGARPQPFPTTADDRPPATVTMTLAGADARRGAPLHLRGQVVADGDPCGHVGVEIILKSKSQGEIAVGALATDERGNYDGSLVLPANLPLGDWDAIARTLGDARCGRGIGPR